MAPIAATVALSHVEGVSDSARARELYKYYQPNAPINADTCFTAPKTPSELPDDAEVTLGANVKSAITSSKISSPDTALTAFCQLVTWRTGAQRAMLSLIDDATQYFIAESTKTVDLIDNTQHAPGDDIWMGCSTVSKAGRLCERTIEAPPTKPGDYPCFIVNDLTKEDRFNELPFVTGAPFLKFYAGVPLITKRGIPIGSLFIVDSRPRDGLSKDNVHFMGTMATTVMKHLEMTREVEEHRRGMKMSRGLASFVEGRSELVEAEVDTDNGEGTKIAGQFETDSGFARSKSKSGGSTGESIRSIVGSVSSVERKEREYSTALVKTEEAILASHDFASDSPRPVLDSGSQPNSFGGTSISVSSPPVDSLDADSPGGKSETSVMKILFSRAANLIKEAFEVDGGCVFYDTQRGFSDSPPKSSPGVSLPVDDSQMTSGDDLPSSSEAPSDYEEKEIPKADSPGLGERMYSRSSVESDKLVEILGFSTTSGASIHGDEYPIPGAEPQCFKPFDEKSLNTLLRRYPRGKLWTFDSDGAVSSSSEEELARPSTDPIQHGKDLYKRQMRKNRIKSDARFLSRHFPGVRQLLFVPLWDAGRSRWLSGCCVWSNEATRILSKQSELNFLTAFGNSVMAECSRLDTEIADQKKGDFIGSISHELRSPLHGILASAEFLEQEPLSGFVKGLVATIDSCGRTLLDTINHILDFSKINNFEKTWRKNKRGGTRSAPRSSDGALALRQSDIPMINLFADIDISNVCEEVVESVFSGHVYQNATAQSFDMVPSARGRMSDASTGLQITSDHASQVAVIFDVDIQNYQFTTQPGAFRRIIMNLLGNALKYTSHGYVRVSLSAKEIEDLYAPGSGDPVQRSLVTLTVMDTGKGISSEFLRSKLFTPFAQENSLSSGTGLGLSIVKSIVSLLEGEITIDSEVGHGTQVKVSLPLLREMPKAPDSTGSTPKSVTSLPREADESVANLRARVVGLKASLCGFDIVSPDPVIRKMGKLLERSVTNFLTQWYGMQVVPLGQKADLVIANEIDPTTIEKLIRQGTTNRKKPTILVLCPNSRFDRTRPTTNINVGFVAKPVGPLKLARALLQCLDGVPPANTPRLLESSPSGNESSDLSQVFEEMSISPHTGEMLDNSRMAADSDNARKAIESPTPNAAIDKHQEFPFPASLPAASSMPEIKDTLAPLVDRPAALASEILTDIEKSASAGTSSNPPPPQSERRKEIPKPNYPRLLLVEDNNINLNLLRMYMRKRKYDVVDEAENGLEAVKKFSSHPEGYDIVFMDISMPVLDGFGATREIRNFENSRGGAGGEGKKGPALIIALTGLASSRDQAEAAECGIDLFLTKPVAFKEVGKLLDNWEANRGK